MTCCRYSHGALPKTTLETRKTELFMRDLYLPMAQPPRWRQVATTGLGHRLGQGRGAHTPLSSWSGQQEGPSKRATWDTSTAGCQHRQEHGEQISLNLCIPHLLTHVAVACSICMLISELIYSVLYLTRTTTLRKICIVPQAINSINYYDNLIDGES
jgi:hypothetical protein